MSADDDYQTWRGDGSAVTEPLTEFQHTSKYAHNRLKCPACAAEITREHIAAGEARRVEQALIDRILFIAGEGEGIPVLRDDVPKFVLMGLPRELIDELAALIAEGEKP